MALNITRRALPGQDTIVINPGTPEEVIIELLQVRKDGQVKLALTADLSVTILRQEIIRHE